MVVWGPGYTGAQALRETARRPELKLVGCLAYSPAKGGLDAMAFAGGPPGGVEIVTDKQRIYDLDADVVLYAGRALPDETPRHEEICALLRDGKNVVTSTAYFFPWQRGEEYVTPLEAACRKGGTTLHGTGVHPGWFVERFAVTTTSLCTSVREVHLREIVDLSHHAGEAIAGIGYGMPPERLGSKTRKTILSRYYFECIAGLAHHLGLPVEEMTADIRYLTSNRELECAGVTVRPGTVGAIDGLWSGLVAAKPVVTIRELWYLDRDLVDPDVNLVSDDIYEVEGKGLPSTSGPAPTCKPPIRATSSGLTTGRRRRTWRPRCSSCKPSPRSSRHPPASSSPPVLPTRRPISGRSPHRSGGARESSPRSFTEHARGTLTPGPGGPLVTSELEHRSYMIKLIYTTGPRRLVRTRQHDWLCRSREGALR